MFSIGKKGSTGVIIASAVIFLLIFTVNSALNSTEENEAFLNMQVSRETVLKTENVIRILDKATSKIIFDKTPNCKNISNVGEFKTEFDKILASFESENSGSIDCKVEIISETGTNDVEVTGTLTCTSTLKDFSAQDVRVFQFNKRIVDTDPAPGVFDCEVRDSITNEIEIS